MMRSPISASAVQTVRFGLTGHRGGAPAGVPRSVFGISRQVATPARIQSRSISTGNNERGDVSAGAAMNIGKAVVKSYEGETLKAMADAPVSILEGIAAKREAALTQLKITTVRQLGQWKFHRIAKSIVALAATEDVGGSIDGSGFNINKAVDKAYETVTLNEILAAPPSALSGLTEAHDDILKVLQIKSVKDLGMCKWMVWAEAIVFMSDFDSLES